MTTQKTVSAHDLAAWIKESEHLLAQREHSKRAYGLARSAESLAAKDLERVKEEMKAERSIFSNMLDALAPKKEQEARRKLEAAQEQAREAKRVYEQAEEAYMNHSTARPVATPAMLADAEAHLASLEGELRAVEEKDPAHVDSVEIARVRQHVNRVAALHSLNQATDEQLAQAHDEMMRAERHALASEGLAELAADLDGRIREARSLRREIADELRHYAATDCMARIESHINSSAMRKLMAELGRVAPGACLRVEIEGAGVYHPGIMIRNAAATD